MGFVNPYMCYRVGMKEGFSRRDVLKGALAAAAGAAFPETAHGNMPERARHPDEERATALRRATDALAETAERLQKARQSGDTELEMRLRKEFETHLERAQRILDELLK